MTYLLGWSVVLVVIDSGFSLGGGYFIVFFFLCVGLCSVLFSLHWPVFEFFLLLLFMYVSLSLFCFFLCVLF